MSACTRANPDAVGGNGGNGGGGAAGSGGSGGGGGTGGSGGGGTGGLGGSGGGGSGGADLSMADAHDMARPPDMTSFNGISCGATSCDVGDYCCIGDNGPHCTTDASCSGSGHPVLMACDGPEDCTSGLDGQCCANTSGSACNATCAGIGPPMCHTLADCPALGGYKGCCPIMQLPQYRVCATHTC